MEPNSLECCFRLDMSIKIKLIVIVGVQPPGRVMKSKLAELPMGTAITFHPAGYKLDIDTDSE